MTKIAIVPNAAGTGTFTIEAPNSNSNRTLTLPDSAGTVATAESTLAQFNATGSAPVFAARAWVNFNGTGTVAIRASGNVSSITDNGTGDYTINFTTAMPDNNYVMAGMAQSFTTTDPGGGVQPVLHASNFTSVPTLKTTTQCRILAGTSTVFDIANISLIFMR
jgi:hypothetical protein